MKVKEGFLVRKIGEQVVVVAVGKASKDFNGMIKLNSVGEFLWEKMEDDKTEEDLVNAVLEQYDVEKDQAAKDVEYFVKTLAEAGILE